MQPRVVPAIPSFHVNEKSVVPSSHSKSEPGQDLVWTEWLLALGCLQLMMNLLRYALTDELFNLESLC